MIGTMDANAVKHGTDVLAAGATALAVLEWMPEIAALCAVIWYMVRFVEYGHGKYKAYKERRESNG